MKSRAHKHKAGRPKINEDYTWYRLKMAKSPIHRHGVIADQKIPRNQYVIEYTGVLLNQAQTKKLEDHTYVWQIGWNERPSYWSIDGRTNGSGAEYVNHSCDPNLQVWFIGRRVYYISRRPIKKGEELTIDYSFDWSEDPNDITKCSCGTRKCRGTINCKDS
jgi:SET domain-containing protein